MLQAGLRNERREKVSGFGGSIVMQFIAMRKMKLTLGDRET